MTRRTLLAGLLILVVSPVAWAQTQRKERLYNEPINVIVPAIASDRSVRYDFDIVYCRARRAGDEKHKRFFTEIATPVYMEPGCDLMLLHPDGSEEVLVASGEKGAITDPAVSFDGQWVYYSHLYDVSKGGQHEIPPGGADIFKIHLKTRKVVKLTTQEYTPNTGAADWSSDFRKAEKGKTHLAYGVYNMGACPLPGGKVMFTSNRNAFRPPKHPAPCLQLFVMDDSDDGPGRNVECVGHLNLGMALHPVVLMDGRVMFSSLESQGLRSSIEWGLWVINPDGTNWRPVLSAFRPGGGAPNAFHFQAQLSDGSIVAEEYYNQNNSGFGAYYKLPAPPMDGYIFGPAYMRDPRNPRLRVGRFDNGKPQWTSLAFSPPGIEALTPFTHPHDGPAHRSVRGDKSSPAVGKFAHPSPAPDNHLLTSYSPGPSNHQYTYLPQIDSGIYLIKSGQPIEEPAAMLLIKNDPEYNEHFPKAVVPYQRLYGVREPTIIEPLKNDGSRSRHLPEGTPFALVGTSSFYKRETFPNGVVKPGTTHAAWAGEPKNGFEGLEPFNSPEESSLNWKNQGADAGKYTNDDIHAVRILAMEGTTHRHRGEKSGRLFYSHAQERLRILGEIPLRKFDGRQQPVDPDGNPDTSFLSRVPADTAFTFQTLDRNGMVLNMAQTWHQLRPGEIRTNCGGCHAHSQQPTAFEKTYAGREDYALFDLAPGKTPLLTGRKHDQSKRKWDAEERIGLRYADAPVVNVEYHRDIKPILARSCNACHTKSAAEPAGNLVLDDDEPIQITHGPRVPGTYYRLAHDTDYTVKFGRKPVCADNQWKFPNASRYVRMFQSRRSLLVWKIFGQRLDGWSNDDFPTEVVHGDFNTLMHRGQKLEPTRQNRNRADLDYTGSPMPPPEAVAGTYKGPDGKAIRVEPLSDDDRLTIVRWVDLGYPIELDVSAQHGQAFGYGWHADDHRPTLALTWRHGGSMVVGAYDYYSGLDERSLSLVADFALDGIPAGQDLAPLLRRTPHHTWESTRPIPITPGGTLTLSVKDRAGNITRIERTGSPR